MRPALGSGVGWPADRGDVRSDMQGLRLAGNTRATNPGPSPVELSRSSS
jgi:hypothetical protein